MTRIQNMKKCQNNLKGEKTIPKTACSLKSSNAYLFILEGIDFFSLEPSAIGDTRWWGGVSVRN